MFDIRYRYLFLTDTGDDCPMDSRALEIEQRRRKQPLAELERKHLKAIRRKGKLFTVEHLDYAYVWAEDMAQFLSTAAARNLAEVPMNLFRTCPCPKQPPESCHRCDGREQKRPGRTNRLPCENSAGEPGLCAFVLPNEHLDARALPATGSMPRSRGTVH
jgi:hypothetical protein